MDAVGSAAPVTELPAGASGWLHDLARGVGKVLYRPAYRIRLHGLDRVPLSGRVVLVANHLSLVEPQLLFGLLPRRVVFLVKEEVFATAAGFWLRKLGQLALRRGEPDRMPLFSAVRVLRRGGLIAVFPDADGGDVTHAEHGAAWLVRQSGATVLPVAVRGARRPAGASRRFRPTIDLLVGKPFSLSVGPGRTGLERAGEQMRLRLAQLVAELDDLRGEGGQSHGRTGDPGGA